MPMLLLFWVISVLLSFCSGGLLAGGGGTIFASDTNHKSSPQPKWKGLAPQTYSVFLPFLLSRWGLAALTMFAVAVAVARAASSCLLAADVALMFE
eukprot:1705606-Amphidinium_carterae.1